MLIRQIKSMFPVGTWEVFQYRENKFALYFSGDWVVTRASLAEVESILQEKRGL